MPVVIEQTFPLGRFHAKRWNQPPFDPNSVEWPPSPWRLLRAIAARWFQFERETPDADSEVRDSVLRKLAIAQPTFRLPAIIAKGDLRQYQPTGLEMQFKYKKDAKTKKNVLDYSYRAVSTTLVPDLFCILSPSDPLFWIWETTTLDSAEQTLLAQLLCRIHYFGRAESFTVLQLRYDKEPPPKTNCTMSATPSFGASPVLVNTSSDALIERLLMSTSDKMLTTRPIPQGTAWHYVRIANRASSIATPISRKRNRVDPVDPSIQFARFALDGSVLPLVKNTVQIAEKFREAAMSIFGRCCEGRDEAAQFLRSDAKRYASPTFSGKDRDGNVSASHAHAHFLPIPDRIDPRHVREVIVYAPRGFDPLEVAALKRLRDVQFEKLSCRVLLTGLSGVAAHEARLYGPSTTWSSLTPFVAHRHAKSRGRNRDIPQDPDDPRGSFLAVAARELCQIRHLPPLVEATPIKAAKGQLQFYEFRRARRKARDDAYTRTAGYLRLTFSEPIHGPLCLGYNSHFGMGIFTPASEQS